MNDSKMLSAGAGGGGEDKESSRIEDELSYPLLLSERVRKAVGEAESFKADCSEVGKQAERLSQMLRSAVRLATNASAALYDRPVRRVAAEASRNLERALTLVRKCKRRSILRRVVTITSATDFRKLFALLDASAGDLRWLLSILDPDGGGGGGGGGIVISLPPIASTDPILSWVWSFIATVQMGQPADRIEAASELASLAKDNDRNKKIIVEEGGVPPLLKLLKESVSAEAQIAAATALRNLSNDRDRVRAIVNELGVPLIVQVLGNSPTRVQILVANLVARMAEHDPGAQEDFARENAIRPLVSLLTFEIETFVEEPPKPPAGKHSIHSLVQINKAMEKNSLLNANSNSIIHRPHSNSSSSLHWESSIRGGHHRRDRENESPEVILELKISCAEALWMLAKGSALNSKRITETKGLLCLAKLIEKEQGPLQINCLMTVMEITAAAQSNADLRRSAFRTNSPAGKAVVDQLLRVIKEADIPCLRIPAIKAIGSLARTFPARETRVIGPLVSQLSHSNLDVATEAAIALSKFASPENFLCVEHSKAIIEFKGVPPLLRLLRNNDRTQVHGLILLCYLALHAGNSEALEQARVLTILEGADRGMLAQHPELRELVSKAVYHLNLYHSGVHPHRPSYTA